MKTQSHSDVSTTDTGGLLHDIKKVAQHLKNIKENASEDVLKSIDIVIQYIDNLILNKEEING